MLKIYPKSQVRLIHEVRHACTLLLYAYYLDGASHLHVCACMHMRR